MKSWKRACFSPCISDRFVWMATAWVLLVACAVHIPEPGENHVRWAGEHGMTATLQELSEGRRLVVLKCDGCHAPPRFKRIAPKDWPAIMDSMRVNAELSAREDSLIRNYVTVASGWWRDSLAALRAPLP